MNMTEPDKAKALVAHMNRKLGVSELQAECMLAGSMFGWDTPGADPDRLAEAQAQLGESNAGERGERKPFDHDGVANDNHDSIRKSILAELAKHEHSRTATLSLEVVATMNEQRERVYDFPNGYLNNAEHMFKRLQHEGFTPGWDNGVRDGEYRYGITLPVQQVPQLRALQKANPARWANHPDVAAELNASQQQAECDAEVNRQRLDRLNPEQREWIEKIHYETGLYVGQALDLNDKLHDLAAKHLKLCLINVEEGLSSEQDAARDSIESQVREICSGIKGIKDAKFIYDPRGTTVAVVFESGAYNSFSGGWKVPVDPEYLKSLDVDAFTSEYAQAKP